MTKERREKLLLKETKKECLKDLAKLRASNPDPPMVTQLDLQVEAEEGCGRPACLVRDEILEDLRAELECVKRELAELRGAGEEAGPSTRQRRRRAPPKSQTVITESSDEEVVVETGSQGPLRIEDEEDEEDEGEEEDPSIPHSAQLEKIQEEEEEEDDDKEMQDLSHQDLEDIRQNISLIAGDKSIKFGQKGSRISSQHIRILHHEVAKLARDFSRRVTAHQQAVKAKKLDRLISREDLTRCIKACRDVIPTLLDEVEAAPIEDCLSRFRFFGHLAAYLASIYGHRSCVYTNLLAREVSNHKTTHKYGMAQIYLTPEEYGWCTRWLGLLNRGVPSNRFFFSNNGKGVMKDLKRYMIRAWQEIGLKGEPDFLDIRTAVSTFNFEQNCDRATRESVAQFMCHSLDTQERFYALYKTVHKAKEMRQCFIALSCGEKACLVPSEPLNFPGPSTSAENRPGPSTSFSGGSRAAALTPVRRRLLAAGEGAKRTRSPSYIQRSVKRIKSKYSPVKSPRVVLMDIQKKRKTRQTQKD
uniref:Uncharacterized protein n=1 Tax=Knipowitschia caucasica TaxID=637954 RepID=A0AAV2JLM2_KNICA